MPRDTSRLHMRIGNDMHRVKAKQFARDLPDDFLSLKRGLEQKKITFYCLISCNKSQLYKIFSIERNKTISSFYTMWWMLRVLWLVVAHNLSEYRRMDDILKFSSVIDHKWRQNVVKSKKCHTSCRRMCHWCFYHILTSSVIYYWTDARQHWIYLLIIQ